MLRAILRNAGFSPSRIVASMRGWTRYAQDRRQLKSACMEAGWAWGKELPMLTERDASSGDVGAYFIQDQTVARWIHEASPMRHVDVGSRLDGFVGSLSAFREVDVIDIRDQPAAIRNIRFHQLDLMRELPEAWVACTDSLSCLHTIEHFGLGRYGDPLDIDGHLKGLAQLKRLVKPGGLFYLSTPIGPQRIEFNAHRIFAAESVVGWFKEGWEIVRFAVVDDKTILHESVDWQGPDLGNHFGCNAGVGIIVARKALQP